MNKNIRQSGFTLIEIMVVIAILAILGAAVVPNLLGNVDKARITRTKTDIASLVSALELYKIDNFNYPSTDQGLQALVEKPLGDPEAANWQDGGYVKKLPKDGWEREFVYVSPGSGGDFDIVSYGADGAEGGTGNDADITNWTE